jgi:hypothetical protein
LGFTKINAERIIYLFKMFARQYYCEGEKILKMIMALMFVWTPHEGLTSIKGILA